MLTNSENSNFDIIDQRQAALDSVAKVEKKQWEVNVYSKYAYDDQPGKSATETSER